MKREFNVTGLGLKIDGRMIMPGSKVLLNSQPPAHWSRFGEYNQAPGENRQFEVATPGEGDAEESEEEPAADREGLEDMQELQAKYQEVNGSAPDARWGIKRLKKELGIDQD